MDVREELVELKKVLCECLHFNYDEFSCDMSLDVDLTAENLIAHGVTVQEWISVKDRLPDKHDRYLCNVKAFSFPDLRYFAILKYDDGGFIEGKIYTDDVTHWMPLPEPPKGE